VVRQVPSHPRIGLRGLIVGCMVIIAICPSIVILPMLANLSRMVTQRQAIGILQTTAEGVAEQLGRSLQTQWLQVKRIGGYAEQGEDQERLRLRLSTIVSTDRQYAWLGLADPTGKVLAASAGILEGQSVGERPWFKAGITESFAGDVHGAVLLEKFVPSDTAEPLRLIDFAVPVRRGDGVPVGVVGAHVRWAAIRGLIRAVRGDESIELMLVARDGTVLAGPQGVEGKPLPTISRLAGSQGVVRSGIEAWPDGKTYLTVTIPTIGTKDVPSFGWSLVARQPVEIALVDTYAATSRLMPVILLCGVGIIVAAFVLAWWVSRPLKRLVAAAEALRNGTLNTPMPHERLYNEVSVLSDSLARLDSQAGRRSTPPSRS
jgi:HAMP domain-containing protein